VIARLGHWLTFGGWTLAALTGLRLAFGVYRFARLPTAAKKNYPAALRARWRWRWLCANLHLAYADRHRRARVRSLLIPSTSVSFSARNEFAPRRAFSGRLRYPRARFRPDAHGLVATVKTVPGSGRAEFARNAPWIADAWRCTRVQVTQERPGRVVVRGLRTDPLLVPLSAAKITDNQDVVNRDHDRLYIGRDEWGADRWLPLIGVSGITVAGLPGTGKTSLVNSWLCQLAGSAAVQFVIIDGKGSHEYDEWAPRSWITVGDDLEDASSALEDAHALMRSRFATLLEQTGHRNGWHAGPTPDFPLIVTVIDEAHTFFDLDAVKGDRQSDAHVRACRSLTAQLVKKGRVALMVTIVMTQKATADAIPTAIRDNCPLALSFAVRTKEAAVAALGDGIREYPGHCPTGLQDPAYVGVATASLCTGLDPFVRVRVPAISEAAAADRAAATAHLRADPVLARLRPLASDGPPGGIPGQRVAVPARDVPNLTVP
jgi:S-DNA-T family DNA segregation ATPase FtsK/SpoIIIE